MTRRSGTFAHTYPKYVVCPVPLLCGSLGVHLEVHELHLTHVFAGVIVEIEIYHQVGPSRAGRLIEAIFDAAYGDFVGLMDVLCDGFQTLHRGVDDASSNKISHLTQVKILRPVTIVFEYAFFEHAVNSFHAWQALV